MRVPVDVKRQSETTNQGSNLGERIEQIVRQKGQFRLVTEQSLISESQKDGEAAEEDNISGNEDKNETSEDRLEKLWKQREEMQRTVNIAQQEVWSALDLISFLLSKHSASAKVSMSDYLQERAIVGTLDAKVAAPNPRSTQTKRQLNNVSQFWKSKAFSSASDAMLKASHQLELEAQRESKFWNEVATVKEAEWPVSRHPRDSRAIGVHFGMEESAAQFRNRGFTLLRQDDESGVSFERPEGRKPRKRLHVSISREGKRTSTLPVCSTTTPLSSSTQAELLEARNELFEEELLHEMGREARVLANQGVTSQDNLITISIEPGCDVEIHRRAGNVSHTAFNADNEFGKVVSLTLQDLLIQAHKNNKERRTRTPLPLSQRPAPTTEYAIIRPLAANLRQAVAVHTLRQAVTSSLKASCSAAGLELELQETNEERSSEDAAEYDSTSMAGPSSSALEFILPSKKHLVVRISTDLGYPAYGTVFEVPEAKFDIGLVASEKLTSVDQTVECLAHLVVVDILDSTISKAKSAIEGSAESSVTNLLAGEVGIKSSETLTKIRIGFANGALVMKALALNSGFEKGKKQLLCSWSEKGNKIEGDWDLIGMEAGESASLYGVLDKLTT